MKIESLDTIKNLPTLPAVVQEIQKLLDDPNSKIAQVAEVVSKDQAITSRVIHLVNSAFYGFRENISSIHHAIVLLGLNTVKNLIMGVSVVKMFQDSDLNFSFDHKKFWLHTLSCAMGAKLIARHLKRPEQDEYFLAGLLSDIGLLVIDQYMHDEFKRIVSSPELKNGGYLKREALVLGFTHGEVGAYLARKWRMPEFVVHTMLHHHYPPGMGADSEFSKDKISVVYLADTKAHELPYSSFLPEYIPYRDQDLTAQLHLSEKEIEDIFNQVQIEAKDLAIQWGLK